MMHLTGFFSEFSDLPAYMIVMSLSQAIKSASNVEKAWEHVGCNENKQLCDQNGGGKGWMADNNRQREVYIFVLFFAVQ